MMVKVGIINVTGYIGMELARILHKHPQVDVHSITGRSTVGQKLGEVLPHLADMNLTIEPELGEVTLVFSALPHKTSAEAVVAALERGIKVIDVSADFRLREAKDYDQWYGFAHPIPLLPGEAVYGLVEFHRNQIASSCLGMDL